MESHSLTIFRVDFEESFKKVDLEHFLLDNEMKQKLQCPVCLDILRSPLVGTTEDFKCGHNICKECKPKNSVCPLCRESVSYFPDSSTWRDIKQQRLNCPNRCEWNKSLNELSDHLSTTCPNQVMPCPLSCNEKLERRLLPDHTKNGCKNRVVDCDYCRVKLKHNELSTHHSTCLDFPLKCKHGCPTQLKRRDLKQHENVCAEKIVACQYEQIGCKDRIARKNLQNHEADCIKNHFYLLFSEVISLRKENTEIKKKLEKLESQNPEKQNKLKIAEFELPCNMKWDVNACHKDLRFTHDTIASTTHINQGAISTLQVIKPTQWCVTVVSCSLYWVIIGMSNKIKWNKYVSDNIAEQGIYGTATLSQKVGTEFFVKVEKNQISISSLEKKEVLKCDGWGLYPCVVLRGDVVVSCKLIDIQSEKDSKV